MIYFTADQHFGHRNIIKYCNRPFSTPEEMDDRIIKNHNASVEKNDDVYMLGDLSMSMQKETLAMYVKQLNGRKHLILGNHDRLKNIRDYINIGFTSVHTPFLKVEEFICVHDPALSQADISGQFLCGHIHNLFVKQRNCFNVGVDVHDFYPISINFIREALND